MGAAEIEARDRAREAVLRTAYELSNGDEHHYFRLDDLVRVTGLAEADVLLALQYLQRSGLAGHKATGGVCGIEHRGIVAAERLVKGPPPRQAAPAVIQNFHAPVGAVQTGDQNIARVRQDTGAPIDEVLALIEALRAESSALPGLVRVDALEQLENVKEEVQGAKKPSRLKAALLALWLGTNSAVAFAPKVLELAEKLGIHFPH